jgi:hypothetical protein
MIILQTILLTLAGMAALVLLTALFLRRDFKVEREIVIDRPKEEVFDFIKFLKNKEYYSPHAVTDPAMKKEYRGADGTPGFISIWKSERKEIGRSEHEITKITEGERIDIEIRFTEPFIAANPAYMTTEMLACGRTKVRSGYNGWLNYPMNLACIFIKQKIGKDMETSLDNLKTILEKPLFH